MSWSPCVVGRALMSHKVRRMHQAQLKTVWIGSNSLDALWNARGFWQQPLPRAAWSSGPSWPTAPGVTLIARLHLSRRARLGRGCHRR